MMPRTKAVMHWQAASSWETGICTLLGHRNERYRLGGQPVQSLLARRRWACKGGSRGGLSIEKQKSPRNESTRSAVSSAGGRCAREPERTFVSETRGILFLISQIIYAPPCARPNCHSESAGRGPGDAQAVTGRHRTVAPIRLGVTRSLARSLSLCQCCQRVWLSDDCQCSLAGA